MKTAIRATLALLATTLTIAPGRANSVAPQSLVRDLRSVLSSGQGSNPNEIVEVGPIAYFVAGDAFGRELWHTDGTLAGTRRVKDIAAGADHSDPADLTAVGNLLFFTARTTATQRELWVTDGTASGTSLVVELRPGASSGSPRSLTSFAGRLFFLGSTATFNGVWTSDGTTTGTQPFTAIPPAPSELTVSGNYLYCNATDATGGPRTVAHRRHGRRHDARSRYRPPDALDPIPSRSRTWAMAACFSSRTRATVRASNPS